MPTKNASLLCSPLLCAAWMFVAACARMQLPEPNKNTNWLNQCASTVECGEALECICGLCTTPCASDLSCELYPDAVSSCMHRGSVEHSLWCGQAPFGSLCVPACGDNDACRAYGPGASCQLGVCVRAELGIMVDAGEAPSIELPQESCLRIFGRCGTVIAEVAGRAVELATDADRVYVLLTSLYDGAADGALTSMEQTGRDLRVHAQGLIEPESLLLHDGYAYWSDKNLFYLESSLNRVSLADGKPHRIYKWVSRYFTISGDHVYWHGKSRIAPLVSEFRHAIWRAPTDGSGMRNPTFEPDPAEYVAAPEISTDDNENFISAYIALDAAISRVHGSGETDGPSMWPPTPRGVLREHDDLYAMRVSEDDTGARRANLIHASRRTREERTLVAVPEPADGKLDWTRYELAMDDVYVYCLAVRDRIDFQVLLDRFGAPLPVVERIGGLYRAHRVTGELTQLAQTPLLSDAHLALSADAIFVALTQSELHDDFGLEPDWENARTTIVVFPKAAAANPQAAGLD